MKKINIIHNGKYYNDVREDYRCSHPTIRKKAARFRRIYSDDGDSLVMWDWTEKEKIHPAQGMICNDCKKIIGTSSSCENCILFNKSNGTHLSHCFQGEYETTCKYGEDDTCPANPQSKKFALRKKDEVEE